MSTPYQQAVIYCDCGRTDDLGPFYQLSRLQKAITFAKENNAKLVLAITSHHYDHRLAFFKDILDDFPDDQLEILESNSSIDEVFFARKRLPLYDKVFLCSSPLHIVRFRLLVAIHMVKRQQTKVGFLPADHYAPNLSGFMKVCVGELRSYFRLFQAVVWKHHPKGELPNTPVKRFLDLVFGAKKTALVDGKRIQ